MRHADGAAHGRQGLGRRGQRRRCRGDDPRAAAGLNHHPPPRQMSASRRRHRLDCDRARRSRGSSCSIVAFFITHPGAAPSSASVSSAGRTFAQGGNARRHVKSVTGRAETPVALRQQAARHAPHEAPSPPPARPHRLRKSLPPASAFVARCSQAPAGPRRSGRAERHALWARVSSARNARVRGSSSCRVRSSTPGPKCCPASANCARLCLSADPYRDGRGHQYRRTRGLAQFASCLAPSFLGATDARPCGRITLAPIR